MITRWNLNHKLAVGFAVVLLLLLGNALVSLKNVRSVIDNNAEVTRTHQALAETQAVLGAMQDAETGQRGFIITGEEDYLEPYNAAANSIGERLQQLRVLVVAPSVKRYLPTLESQIQVRLASLRKNIALRRSDGVEAARKNILSGRGKHEMDAVRATIAAIERKENALLDQRESQSRASAQNALLTLGISSLVSLALLILIWFIIGRDAANRQQAATQLKASSDRFGSIVSSTSQIIWTRDITGDFVDDQRSWSAFTGQSFDELKGLGWLQAVHPEDRDETAQGWQQKVQSPDLFEVEYRLRRHDGEYRHMAVRATPVREENGAMREWVGTSADITERKQAAAELHESEARKAAILETSLDCIIAIDADSLITEWNPAAESTFGHARTDVIGRALPELIIPPSLREAHNKGLKHYLETGEGPVLAQRIEVPALHADGHEFPVELAITRIAGGGAPMFSAYLRDITVRKQAEEDLALHARLASLGAAVGLALTRSESQQEILQQCAAALVKHLDAALARVWTLNDIENVLELQASAGLYTHLDGAHSRVPVGQFQIGLIAQERTPHLTNQVIGDFRVADQDWAQREGMVAFAGYPLLVEGRLMGVMAMFARHSLPTSVLRALATVADTIALGVKRKCTEEELERAKQAAEGASHAKSLFLANMSHELRTPLNAILGYSEMLAEDAADQGLENFAPDLEKINGAGKHLLALINDILDLSKIEAGKMELYLEEFDVAQMLDEVTATANSLIEKNGNSLEREYSPSLGTMRGDVTKVRQCLFNLLSNASKFTRDGHITLEVRREQMESMESVESLNHPAPHDWMMFRVTDTGIGMSAEQIVKLFQAFTQADVSTTRKFGGTGLGLALTRSFCQTMGGDVTVQSMPDEGSIFTIKIPTHVEEATVEIEAAPSPENAVIAGEQSVAPNEPLPPPDTCVLVIDDDATQRDLMRRFLIKEGFSAQTASSGEEGLRLAHQLRPIAITLDVMMSGMDGWSVLTALKADAAMSDIPIIMLTMVDDKNRGYALGAADYVTKPVDRAQLSQILRKYICASPPCPVLLVEDDETTRQMMRQMLTKEGWTVEEAANGREALECVAKNRPALILLDLMMPEMDGFEFAAALNRNDEWRSIPIVVLTAKDLTDDDRLRLNGYVEKVLQKSGQSREELMRQVRNLIEVYAAPKTAKDEK